MDITLSGGMFSDRHIGMALEIGTILVRPEPSPEQIQPASLDIRLGGEGGMRYRQEFPEKFGTPVITPGHDQSELMEFVPFDEEGCILLNPGDFLLGTTDEFVGLPSGLAARVEGKSSMGRLGLIIHATAGFIDPGFAGNITLEISNLAPLPIKLCKGMKIGQVAFIPLTSKADRPYGSPGLGSKYQGQEGPTPARALGLIHSGKELEGGKGTETDAHVQGAAESRSE